MITHGKSQLQNIEGSMLLNELQTIRFSIIKCINLYGKLCSTYKTHYIINQVETYFLKLLKNDASELDRKSFSLRLIVF